MFEQFFDLFFNYLNSLLYAGMNLIGIYAGVVLLNRTRNRGPFLILVASVIKLFVGLSFPLANFLWERYHFDYNVMQQFWLGLSLLDLTSTTLLLVGVTLVAKDLRALIDAAQLQSIRG